jgi:hypothetical protein
MALEYKYRVALVRNRKIHKVIKDYKILKHATNKFNKIKGENQVFYEKKYKNYKKIERVTFEILLLEKTDGEKQLRKVINGFGDIVKEKVSGNWKILDKFQYKEEEDFHVYGLNRRLIVPDILTEVLLPRINTFYHIIMVFNKIVLYNDSDIEVILCKNIPEAERFYDYLFNFFLSKGFLNLLFLGKADKKTRSSLYDRIQEHTGLTRREMYRTSTRS